MSTSSTTPAYSQLNQQDRAKLWFLEIVARAQRLGQYRSTQRKLPRSRDDEERLVANVIETAGVATACLSLMPPLTVNTGAPRVIGVPHPPGLPMGLPGDADGQRTVLREALEATASMDAPRSYHELDRTWPERRSQAIREADPPPPIAQLLSRKPWLLPRLVSGRLPH